MLVRTAWWLVIIGAINWGLIGLLGIDLVATLFGSATMLSRVVYILVGLSGILLIIDYFQPTMLKR